MPGNSEFSKDWAAFEKGHCFKDDWANFEKEYSENVISVDAQLTTHKSPRAPKNVDGPKTRDMNIGLFKGRKGSKDQTSTSSAPASVPIALPGSPSGQLESASKEAGLRLLPDEGAGLFLRWRRDCGYRIERIDSTPGQPDLSVGLYITEINKRSLCHKTEPESEDVLRSEMQDGAILTLKKASGEDAPIDIEDVPLDLQKKGEEGDGLGPLPEEAVPHPSTDSPQKQNAKNMMPTLNLQATNADKFSSSEAQTSVKKPGESEPLPSPSEVLTTPRTGTPRKSPREESKKSPRASPRSSDAPKSDFQSPRDLAKSRSQSPRGLSPVKESPRSDVGLTPKSESRKSILSGSEAKITIRSQHTTGAFFTGPGERDASEEEKVDEDSKLGIRFQQDEMESVMETWAADQKAQLWMRFDLLCGSMVILNAIILGIQTNDSTMEDPDDHLLSDETNVWIERYFLVVFTMEFIYRISWIHCAAFKDGWMYLDLFLIGISALDVFHLTDMLMGGVENPGMFTILRAFRLVRLFRVIRLVRLMKELWLLVQALMRAIRTLIWAVMLLMLGIYILSIMLCEMVGKHADDVDKAAELVSGTTKHHWGRLPHAMLTLAQIVTMDDWSGMLRPFWFYSGLVYAFLALFLMVCGLGIMNLVVGVMCETSIEVSQNDEKVNNQLKFVKEYHALMSLRSLFLAKYAMGKGTNLLRSELAHCIDDPDDSRCRDLLKTAGLERHDVVELLDAMHIFGNRKVEVDKVIEGLVWLRGDVKDRALDIFLCNLQAQKLTKTLALMAVQATKSLKIIKNATASLENCIDPDDQEKKDSKKEAEVRRSQARQAKRWLDKSLIEAAGDASLQHDVMAAGITMSRKEHDLLEDTLAKDRIGKTMAAFDSISATLVLLNAAMIGMSIDNVAGDVIDYIFIENIFCLVFIIELHLRILYYVQLNMEGDFDGHCCFCCPKDQLGHWGTTAENIKRALPELIKDKFFIMDVVVVSLSLMDAVIYYASSETTPLSGLALLRIVRLARTARVFRLVKRMKELLLLVSALAGASKTLFWSCGLLGVCIYVGSILMTDSFKEEEWAQDEWGQVGKSMWSLIDCVTFAGWAKKVRHVGDHSILYFMIILVFIILCALGIMNLIVGLMCDTALNVVAENKTRQFRLEMVKLQHSVHFLELEASESDLKSCKELTHHQLHQILHKKEIVKQFHDHGRMTPHDVRDIFKKLDVRNEGYVSMDLFIDGLLRSREMLSNEELIIASVMMGSVKNEAIKMQRNFDSLRAEIEASAAQIAQSKAIFDEAKANKTPVTTVVVAQTEVAQHFHKKTAHKQTRSFIAKESDELYHNSYWSGGTAGPHDQQQATSLKLMKV